MRAWLALGPVLLLAACAQSPTPEGGPGDGARAGEVQLTLPEFPKPADYLPLKVSATTPFTFFVDAKSVSVDKDGVVRYSLIAKSAEGVVNVSFEGIRCSVRQYRVFAYGRPDNTWSEVRNSQWRQIPPDVHNAQRAVLYNDYLCAARMPIGTAEEAVGALRRGPLGSRGL